MPRLKVLASHPVQYLVPLYRALVEAGLDLEVGYYHGGAAGQAARDPEFGIDFAWDMDLLSGYASRVFLRGPATYSPAEQARAAPSLLAWALAGGRAPLLLVGWFAEIAWLAWLLRVLLRRPVLVMAENTPQSFAAAPKPAWRVRLLRWLLRRASACLYIGRRNREFLRSMGVPETRLFAAPYSVDNARFQAEHRRLLPARAALCLRHGLDPEQPVFLFCGKLTPKKRPMQLLEAYLQAGLRDCAQLLFVGEGVLRPALEQRAAEAGAASVRVLGFLNQTRMPLAYVLGETLCLISDPTETWGLVVNEALACGRPVIVSETVGCRPDLVGPENGWVVPLDDASALAAALRRAYDCRAAWPALGERGRCRVAAHTFAQMASGVRAALAASAARAGP